MTKEKRLYMQDHLMGFVKDARDNKEMEETFAVAFELAWSLYFMEVITWSTYLRFKNLLLQWRYPRRRSIAEEDLFRADM